jgi:hypothetical protein
VKKMKILTKTGILIGAFLASITSAYAAVPADVTTALTDAKTDVITVAGLALVAVLAAVAFKYMRRAL